MIPTIEVVYVPPEHASIHRHVTFNAGMTVSDALLQAGFLSSHPEVAHLPLGIFATRVTLETLLKPGDRIEIYRSLSSDPKEKRRQRARGQ